MAAGTTIKLKRKAGAATGGDLVAGELLMDVSNDLLYGSSDGATVWSVGAGTGDALTSNGLGQFAATTTVELAGVITTTTGSGALVFGTSPTLTTPALGVATVTSLNGATITTTNGSLTLANGSTLATSGAYSQTLTATGATNVTLPTSGTLATESYVDTAVSGGVTYRGGYNASTNSPDLDTSPSGVIQGDMYTVTAAGTFFSTAVAVGDVMIAEADNATTEAEWTIVEKNLDGAALTSGTLAQFAATPTTSAELAGIISNETGSGALVFAISPTLTTPTIGVATATSVNKITVTAPATGATLTLSDGSSLITSGGHSITLTSSGATNITLPTTGTVATLAGTETLTNKTISAATNTIDGGTI